MDPSIQLFFSLLALVITLVLGIYFSAAEMAFSSLNRTRVKSLAEHEKTGEGRANLVLDLYENKFDEVLSTLLICNNTVAIASATLSAALFVQLLGEWGYLVSTVVISVIIIVFTDILPKSLSKEQPEKVAMNMAFSLSVLLRLLKPANWAVGKIKNGFNSILTPKVAANHIQEQELLEQELIFMVEEAEKEGTLDENDSELITNAIEFHDITVGDILTPRVDVVAISHEATHDEVLVLFLDSEYSRLLIYEETLDQIKGVLHLRDFLKCINEATEGSPPHFSEVILPAIFTVTSAHISDVLKLFQAKQTHLAIVTDEFGGTEGIVTMDDILGQLVGEIWDEHDEVIPDILEIGEGRYRVQCSTYLDDLFDFFEVDVAIESSTVGGWIVDEIRRVPKVGDGLVFENLQVTVTKTDERRVVECLVEKLE